MAFVADNRLNPNQRPYPPGCVNGVLNLQCANEMAALCTTNTSNGPALLDGLSNCLTWRNLVETAYDNDPVSYAPLQNELDDTIEAYCNLAGRNSNACSCMNFPTLLAQQCNAQGSRGCNEPDPKACYGKYFTRAGGSTPVQTPGGEWTFPPYIEIQFEECIPYWCWNDLCWQPDALLVSKIRTDQNSCIDGICISIQGVDTISIPQGFTPPPSADTFRPRQFVMTQCGQGYQTATPVLIPTLLRIGADSVDALPFAISNVGDDILNMTLSTVTNDLFQCLPPSVLTISPKNSNNFNVRVDPTLMLQRWKDATDPDVDNGNVSILGVDDLPQIPVGVLQSPTFFYTYNAGLQRQTFSYNINLVLLPAISDQTYNQPTVVNKRIPLGVNIGVIAAAFICFIAIVVLLAIQGKARSFAEQSFTRL